MGVFRILLQTLSLLLCTIAIKPVWAALICQIFPITKKPIGIDLMLFHSETS